MVFTFTTAPKLRMDKENITNQIDSSTQTFGISTPYEAGTIRLYWNGVRQIVNVTFSELNSSQIYTNFIPQTGDYLVVEYIPL